MIRAGMINNSQQRMNSSGFPIIRAVHKAPNTRMNQGARAHGARFNCSKQFAVN